MHDLFETERLKMRELNLSDEAVIRKDDEVFLGDCGVTMQNIDHEILPEIGFHIKEAYGRQGYATEAAIGALHYVKATYHLTRTYSYCSIENTPSQGVMQKIGVQFMKIYKQGEREIVVYKKNI